MPGLVELECLAMAGHYPEILISGQRLDGQKASVFARLKECKPQAGDAADHWQSRCADVDSDVAVDHNFSEPGL